VFVYGKRIYRSAEKGIGRKKVHYPNPSGVEGKIPSDSGKIPISAAGEGY